MRSRESRYIEDMMDRLKHHLQVQTNWKLEVRYSNLPGPDIAPPYFVLVAITVRHLFGLIPYRRRERWLFAIHDGFWEQDGRRKIQYVLYRPIGAQLEAAVEEAISHFMSEFNIALVDFQEGIL